MLGLCRGEEQSRWRGLFARENGERFRDGGTEEHRLRTVELEDGHGSELTFDLTLLTESEDCLGESKASLGRIDGTENLVERIIEGLAVIVAECVDVLPWAASRRAPALLLHSSTVLPSNRSHMGTVRCA